MNSCLVLALLGDFLFWWQIPIMLAFLALWLVPGTMLSRRRLQAVTGLSRGRVASKALMFNVLTGAAGLAAFGVTAFFCWALYQRGSYGFGTMAMLAGITGSLVMLLFANGAGIAVAKELPAGKALSISLPISALVLVGMLATAAGAVLPAYRIAQAQQFEKLCMAKQQRVIQLLAAFRLHHPNVTPTLADIVPSDKTLQDEGAGCPAGPKDTDYICVAPPSDGKKDPKRIIICDAQPYHRGSRVVTLDDSPNPSASVPKVLKEKDFQELLALPVNATVAEKLKKQQ